MKEANQTELPCPDNQIPAEVAPLETEQWRRARYLIIFCLPYLSKSGETVHLKHAL